MNDEQYKAVISALCDFVVRAAKENATPEEIAVLPEVARAIKEITRLD